MCGNNQSKSSQGEETFGGAHHRSPHSQRGICHLPSWEENVTIYLNASFLCSLFFVSLLVWFGLLLRLTLYSRRICLIDMTVKPLEQKLQPPISVSVDSSHVFD